MSPPITSLSQAQASIVDECVGMGFERQVAIAAVTTGDCKALDAAVEYCLNRPVTDLTTASDIDMTDSSNSNNKSTALSTVVTPRASNAPSFPLLKSSSHEPLPSNLFTPPAGKAEDNDDELTKAIAESMKPQQKHKPDTSGIAGPLPQTDEEQLQAAMYESMKQSSSNPYADSQWVDPVDPTNRQRADMQTPVGLKNVGNVCYLNSLLQVYFFLRPKLFELVMSYSQDAAAVQRQQSNVDTDMKNDAVKAPAPSSTAAASDAVPAVADAAATAATQREAQTKAALDFVQQLQRIFAYLQFSTRKYADPGPTVQALFRANGNQSQEKLQHDVSEFQEVVIDTLVKAFKAAGDEPSEKQLHSLFYGTATQHLSAVHDSERHDAASEITYGNIILDITGGELLAGIDDYMLQHIEYRFTSQQVDANARQELWLKTLPSVLCFQLQRVGYDAVKKEAIKRNTRFDYPQTLYMDRYMADNKELSCKLREQQATLAQQKAELTTQLAALTNYQNKSVHIGDALELASAFLQQRAINTAESSASVSADDQTTSVVAYLNKVVAEVKQQQLQLENQIQQLKVQLSELYDDPALQHHQYTLFAALVHDGTGATSGHYWSYLRRIEDKQWYKFNDSHVTAVDEEKVYSESVGGHKSASAYCLIYLKTADIQGASQTAIDDMIPAHLRAEVEADNVKFATELVQWSDKKLTAASEIIVKQVVPEAKTLYLQRDASKGLDGRLRSPAHFVAASANDELGWWYTLFSKYNAYKNSNAEQRKRVLVQATRQIAEQVPEHLAAHQILQQANVADSTVSKWLATPEGIKLDDLCQPPPSNDSTNGSDLAERSQQSYALFASCTRHLLAALRFWKSSSTEAGHLAVAVMHFNQALVLDAQVKDDAYTAASYASRQLEIVQYLQVACLLAIKRAEVDLPNAGAQSIYKPADAVHRYHMVNLHLTTLLMLNNTDQVRAEWLNDYKEHIITLLADWDSSPADDAACTLLPPLQLSDLKDQMFSFMFEPSLPSFTEKLEYVDTATWQLYNSDAPLPASDKRTIEEAYTHDIQALRKDAEVLGLLQQVGGPPLPTASIPQLPPIALDHTMSQADVAETKAVDSAGALDDDEDIYGDSSSNKENEAMLGSDDPSSKVHELKIAETSPHHNDSVRPALTSSSPVSPHSVPPKRKFNDSLDNDDHDIYET